MNTLSSGLTHVGRRSNNEDALLEAPGLGLFAVADGLGGYEGGEIASKLTVSVLEKFVMNNQRDPQGTWPIRESKSRTFEENLLAAASAAAHLEIAGRRTGTLSQMGSTVVAALLRGDKLTVMHCGDSRIYRLRGGEVKALTRDHSVWAEMEAAGLAGERAGFAWKNQITRALGLDGHSMPDVVTLELKRGDVYLLCSDGLYDPLRPERLAAGLTLEPEAACRDLVSAAFEAGSHDNITAVVVRCG
ncbi:MAG: protein phosphatase 2C domain-containing protein [Archangium sp.]|nr:protein phosphatase 2C domain-containing protein [Archangium sp.]